MKLSVKKLSLSLSLSFFSIVLLTSIKNANIRMRVGGQIERFFNCLL